MTTFQFSPATFIPFRDKEVIERVRKIKKEDLTKHSNPDFKIRIVKDPDVEFMWMADMFHRIQSGADTGRNVVMIVPNPELVYRQVAHLINKCRVNCRHLHTFNMDEYANEHGDIAPETWPWGFMHSFKRYFYNEIDPELRPPESQMHGPTNKNLKDYGKMIADLGGADVCYSGPGWTGHLAFIEADAPEFAGALEEWKTMGTRVCTLNAFTIAANSLFGSFGMSGDLTAVPPKAATIGPAEVIAAKHRLEMHFFTIGGSPVSWQRLSSRMVLHGPVTPRWPSSILQTLRTDCLISETIAQDIEPDWDKGY